MFPLLGGNEDGRYKTLIFTKSNIDFHYQKSSFYGKFLFPKKMCCISKIGFAMKILLFPCVRRKTSFPTGNVSLHERKSFHQTEKIL